MKKGYIWKRLLRSFLSVFIIMIIVFIMLYSLVPRDNIFFEDATYKKLGGKPDDKREYVMRTWEKLGYLDYETLNDFCATKYEQGSPEMEAALENGSKEYYEFIDTYQSKGYTVEYLQLSKAHSDSGAKALEDLKLILSDGSVYTGAGMVDQVDREIGSGTGALTLKARFSNDNNILMPGMFARLQANAGTIKNAMLVPQRAVKEMLYKKFVFTVGSDNKVDMKEVTLGARVGKLWLVESGLNGDETLVVEGIQKVNKGSEVKPAAMTEADLSNESKQ